MWHEFAEYARRAPSPHNTQPARLRVVDAHHAEVYFATDRGLPVGDPEGRFTHATFGIFVESLRIAAHARGQALDTTFAGEPLRRSGRDQKVADLRLHDRGAPIPDLDLRCCWSDAPTATPTTLGRCPRRWSRSCARRHGVTVTDSTSRRTRMPCSG